MTLLIFLHLIKHSFSLLGFFGGFCLGWCSFVCLFFKVVFLLFFNQPQCFYITISKTVSTITLICKETQAQCLVCTLKAETEKVLKPAVIMIYIFLFVFKKPLVYATKYCTYLGIILNKTHLKPGLLCYN